MTRQEQEEAEKVIHEMADQVKRSNGGWWETYANSLEKRIVALSFKIKTRQK